MSFFALFYSIQSSIGVAAFAMSLSEGPSFWLLVLSAFVAINGAARICRVEP